MIISKELFLAFVTTAKQTPTGVEVDENLFAEMAKYREPQKFSEFQIRDELVYFNHHGNLIRVPLGKCSQALMAQLIRTSYTTTDEAIKGLYGDLSSASKNRFFVMKNKLNQKLTEFNYKIITRNNILKLERT